MRLMKRLTRAGIGRFHKMMKKVEWYVNRLSLMSLPEIGHRLKAEVRKKFESRKHLDIKVKKPQLHNKVHWYMDLSQREKILAYIIENNFGQIPQAKALLKHRFSYFSFEGEEFGENIDWHRDYKSQKRAPLSYGKSIDYRDFKAIGDIKYIWEMNRHQHLIILAKAYYLSGEMKYKREIEDQILDWIKQNPYKMGVNWTSALEVGIRLISWSWVWAFLQKIDGDVHDVWVDSIYKHCSFIDENFSKYSSANNHLIGEASGLLIAGIFWPYWEESKKWRETGHQILTGEIEKQTYADGVNKEQAIGYQPFIFDLFLLPALLGEKNGITFPSSYWDRLETMLDFWNSMMNADHLMPNIGDADDGRAVILSHWQTENPFQSLLLTGAGLFKRGDLNTGNMAFDEKSFWLLGFEGVEQFYCLKKIDPKGIKKFQEGGYFILSDEDHTKKEIKSIFDCGSLGYLSICAHGHCDALSMMLSIGGLKFLIDPGTYGYFLDQKWRNYFRSTAAHNTVGIDHRDQSEMGGSFMFLNKAEANAEQWESNGDHDRIIGSHNGYRRLKDPVDHQREVFFDKRKKIIKITDRITAREEHLIEQCFHFSSQCSLQESDKGGWEITNGDQAIRMTIDPRLKTEIYRGSSDPIYGWQSNGYDTKIPADTMVNRMTHRGSCVFETLIVMDKNN